MKAVENLETSLLGTIQSHRVHGCLVYPGAQTTSYRSNPVGLGKDDTGGEAADLGETLQADP